MLSSRRFLALRGWTLLVIAAWATLALGPVHAQSTDRQVVELSVNQGEQLVLPAQGVKSYSEGTRGVIDVRLTGDASRFVVVGLSAGVTTLLLLMVDGSERHFRVTVIDPNHIDKEGTPPPDKNPLAVAPQINIRLDLYFVQLDRSYTHAMGFNYPTNVGSAAFTYSFDIPTRALASNSAIVGASLLPQLELAQSQGWAKLSRHVAVITSNGTEAKFDSGGEFNVQIVQAMTSSVSSIRYGSILGVKPRYDEVTKRIELGVEAEVSDLAATGANIPGRNRSNLETVVNLALGESLAVAGLSAKSRERQLGGLPWLSQIPILGLLFGKQNAREQNLENMVFIVPSIVEPMHRARAKEFLSDALQAYDDYSGRFSSVKPFFSTPDPVSPTSPAKAQ